LLCTAIRQPSNNDSEHSEQRAAQHQQADRQGRGGRGGGGQLFMHTTPQKKLEKENPRHLERVVGKWEDEERKKSARCQFVANNKIIKSYRNSHLFNIF
jgi:hypothetical protein